MRSTALAASVLLASSALGKGESSRLLHTQSRADRTMLSAVVYYAPGTPFEYMHDKWLNECNVPAKHFTFGDKPDGGNGIRVDMFCKDDVATQAVSAEPPRDDDFTTTDQE